MARLHGDGFDHYGTSLANMLDGEYAQAHGTLSTAQVATGTHSFLVNDPSGLTSFEGLRKVLPSATDKMGAMARFYFNSIPVVHQGAAIFGFNSSSPHLPHVVAFVDSNGCIRFYRSPETFQQTGSAGGGTLIATTDPIITASAWNHVEIQIYVHDTLGWVRVAVNGVHRFEATGLDTKANTESISSVSQYIPYLDGHPFYMDDYALYDFTGDSAVDTDWCPPVDAEGKATGYIGDLGAYLLVPNGDTAEDDWIPSTGTDSYATVDEVDPDDNDYLYSTAVNDLVELALTDLPEEITYIRGLDVIGRLSKADAGAAGIKLGMKSVASVTDAAERPLTVEPTYWRDQVNVDPDSLGRWTRASLNAAWFRLTRSL